MLGDKYKDLKQNILWMFGFVQKEDLLEFSREVWDNLSDRIVEAEKFTIRPPIFIETAQNSWAHRCGEIR